MGSGYGGRGGDLAPGENYVRAIEEGLKESRWFVVLVSRNSVSSAWVSDEVRIAASLTSLRGRIIPVLLDETAPAEISAFLGPLQFIDARKLGSVADGIYERVLADR